MVLLNIAVVDDEKAHAAIIRHYIEKYKNENQIKCNICEFSDAEKFLFHWEENQVWDALFLDIQMPGLDGMNLARRIRSQNKHVVIVFTTGITDYIQEGYEVDALRYLIKPIDELKIQNCMEQIINQRLEEDKKRAFQIMAEEITENGIGACMALRILPEEIIFVEAFAHHTEIHTRGNRYRVHEGIGVWQKRFEKNSFIACHRSYLVNLLYVSKMKKDEIILDTGERLPLSRRKQKEVNQAFIQFYSRDKGGVV